MKVFRTRARDLDFRLIFVALMILFSIVRSQETGGTQLRAIDSVADTLNVALQDAILFGLENNPTVTIQRLTPQVVTTAVQQARAEFDPLLSVTGQRSESKSLRRLGTLRTPFDLRDKRFDYSVQLAETLPTGTTITAGVGMTGSVSNLYTSQYAGGFDLTITQSLLRGFGTKANLAALRRARLDVDISDFELKGIAESVVADIEKSYWDLYLSREEMTIQKKSLELAEQQLEESLERVAVGKLPSLELAAVDAEVAARKSALIDAQSQHEQARLRFLYLMNPVSETFWSTYIFPTDQPFIPKDSLDAVSVHDSLGLLYRPDLRQAELEMEKGDLEVARTKNGLLPQLDLFITLGRTSYSETFDKNAYPSMSSPFYEVAAGLNFALPVPNRQAAAQVARARVSHEQQELAVDNMVKMVQWDIRSAYAEITRARQQIEATHVTRELQEKRLQAELEKFRVGKSINYLVLLAQRDYTASQLDETRAMVAYLYALIDLYVAEGTLLERRGVKSFEN
ncbi:TolC family protein [candidate division KSB1 bacterium]|nr:TolC family protein [candidate division KSB1 bacterium]RQW10197.1 MAG: TolC family protein [candidate division KSB1 bacterium]